MHTTSFVRLRLQMQIYIYTTTDHITPALCMYSTGKNKKGERPVHLDIVGHGYGINCARVLSSGGTGGSPPPPPPQTFQLPPL